MRYFKRCMLVFFVLYVTCHGYAAIISSLQLLQQSLGQLDSQITPGQDYNKLSWWIDKVGVLPFYGTTLTGQLDCPDEAPLVDEKTYSMLLSEVCALNKEQISKDIDLEKVPLSSFFAEKIAIKIPSTVYCWGDIHGDIHTLVASLQFLKDTHILRDDFTLNHGSNSGSIILVFNGDYVDRGWNGIEVHAVLCLLRKNNPHNVFLVRGNHEDFLTTLKYGFVKEIIKKFLKKNATKEDLDLEKNPLKENPDLRNTLEDFYRYLPTVLYVGAQEGLKLNYLQFCHGALDFYNPINLLSSKKGIDFAIQNRMSSEVAKKNKLLENVPQNYLDYYYDDQETSGFMWNDFNAKNLPTDVNTRGLTFGLPLSDQLLNLSSATNKNVNIIAVFRGHQHNDSMPGLFNEADCNIYKLPYMNNRFVFTTIATPTMMEQYRPPIFLPGRGFVAIYIGSSDPAEWMLSSRWSKCENGNPKKCDEFNVLTRGTLKMWFNAET